MYKQSLKPPKARKYGFRQIKGDYKIRGTKIESRNGVSLGGGVAKGIFPAKRGGGIY